MAQRWSWLPLYSAYRKASRKFLAVITAGTSPRSAGSQAGMTTWTLLPNGGHVTRCEAVWAKREEDGPAAPPATAGFAPSGWKVAGGAEPHAATSAPTPASRAPRCPRHIRHPPPSSATDSGELYQRRPPRFTGPAELAGTAGDLTRPAVEPGPPAENFWPASGGTFGPVELLRDSAYEPLALHSGRARVTGDENRPGRRRRSRPTPRGARTGRT